MPLQVNGTDDLPAQERQLQFVETFFVEVIDYLAASNGTNDVTTRDIPGAVNGELKLRRIGSADELAEIVNAGARIVFDRTAFVEGNRQRVVGFRA